MVSCFSNGIGSSEIQMGVLISINRLQEDIPLKSAHKNVFKYSAITLNLLPLIFLLLKRVFHILSACFITDFRLKPFLHILLVSGKYISTLHFFFVFTNYIGSVLHCCMQDVLIYC